MALPASRRGADYTREGAREVALVGKATRHCNLGDWQRRGDEQVASLLDAFLHEKLRDNVEGLIARVGRARCQVFAMGSQPYEGDWGCADDRSANGVRLLGAFRGGLPIVRLPTNRRKKDCPSFFVQAIGLMEAPPPPDRRRNARFADKCLCEMFKAAESARAGNVLQREGMIGEVRLRPVDPCGDWQ